MLSVYLIVKFTWICKMNKYLTKKMYVIVNIGLFLVEIYLIYLLINKHLSTDFIRPQDITFYEYLLNKITNFI